MKQSERFRIITEMVQKEGSVKVAELSRILDCSEVTVRKDIMELDEQGIVKRTHGGAVFVDRKIAFTFEAGSYFLHEEEKRRIAQRAYEYIEDGDSIIIDDSTTGCYLAQCIRQMGRKGISVVTNSLYSAMILSAAENVNLFFVGGQLSMDPPVALDSIAIKGVARFHVNKAFIGAHGINFKVGLTSMTVSQMEMKQAMIGLSDKIYVMADSSKFGSRNMFTVYGFDRIDRIITDSGIREADCLTAKEMNVTLDIV